MKKLYNSKITPLSTLPERAFGKLKSLLVIERPEPPLSQTLEEYYDYDETADASKKIQVAIITRDGTTHPKSSAFIRLISPLTDPAVAEKISFSLYDENSVNIKHDSSYCIVQRTAFDSLDKAKQLVNHLAGIGAKLIVDSDDAFSSISKSHPEYEHHIQSKQALDFLAKSADQVWVSTKELAKKYKKLNTNTIIISNSLDKRLWMQAHKKTKTLNRKPLSMVYMGTASHEDDLSIILPALDKLQKVHPDSFNLTIIGVGEKIPRRKWINRIYQPKGHSVYPRFVSWFVKQGPFDIGLSPLVDNNFNRGKSDIKCLDYLAAGIVPIVSDVVAYKNPELDNLIIRVKNSPESWFESLNELVTNLEKFRSQHPDITSKANEYIMGKRNSTDVARNIYKLLNSA